MAKDLIRVLNLWRLAPEPYLLNRQPAARIYQNKIHKTESCTYSAVLWSERHFSSRQRQCLLEAEGPGWVPETLIRPTPVFLTKGPRQAVSGLATRKKPLAVGASANGRRCAGCRVWGNKYPARQRTVLYQQSPCAKSKPYERQRFGSAAILGR